MYCSHISLYYSGVSFAFICLFGVQGMSQPKFYSASEFCFGFFFPEEYLENPGERAVRQPLHGLGGNLGRL